MQTPEVVGNPRHCETMSYTEENEKDISAQLEKKLKNLVNNESWKALCTKLQNSD